MTAELHVRKKRQPPNTGLLMLRYVLATELRGVDTEVLLSRTEYDEYSAAWRVVTECLAIEEAFGYVIADMLDLESVIHRHVLDGICTPQGEWSQLMDRLHELSRHVMHLLGSSEAYRERSCNVSSVNHRYGPDRSERSELRAGPYRLPG
jgi:hypothetical protein